jgi:hypothetical protein
MLLYLKCYPQRSYPAKGIIEDDRTPTLILLTVCTAARRPWLADPTEHETLVHVWRSAAHWQVGPYVLVPDHLHLFAMPGGGSATFDRWIQYRSGSFWSLAPYQRTAATASPYLFFSIFRKNGAVRLTLLFATSSGEPVATTSPPNSPASGPISMR